MNSSNSNNKVVKAGAGYVVGNYLLKGITFLSAPIFTRLMSTEDYGNYGTYGSYESILYIIVGLALHSCVNNAKYKYKEKFEEFVSSIVLLTCISTVIWLILANVFYDSYSQVLDFSRLIVNILVLHCFGTSIFQFFNAYVSINYSVKSFLKFTSINALSNMGLSIVLLITIFSGEKLLGRIIGTALPLFCIAIYITIYFFKKNKPTVNKKYWKYALIYSLPIIPHGISQVILSSFDRIMIKNMVGAVEVGIYSFSYSINTLIMVASQSLHKVWKPWLYEKMEQKEYQAIRKQGTQLAFGMALFTGLVIMVSPELIKILGAEEYWTSTSCVIPVVIGGYFSFIYTIPVVIEYYYGKTKYIAIATTMAAIINIVLNYIFIMRYGYIAAAYTTLVTYFIYFVFHFILAAKIHGSNLFSTLELFGICLGLCLVGGAGLLLQNHIIIRWGIEVCMGLYSIYWLDKNFNIRKLVKQKMKK